MNIPPILIALIVFILCYGAFFLFRILWLCIVYLSLGVIAKSENYPAWYKTWKRIWVDAVFFPAYWRLWSVAAWKQFLRNA